MLIYTANQTFRHRLIKYRHYIARAIHYEPVVTDALAEFIVRAYVQKRREAFEAQQKKNGDFIYTQPRTLLAIIRMAQALARLRFRSVIEESDLHEALRLMESSKKSMDLDDQGSKR